MGVFNLSEPNIFKTTPKEEYDLPILTYKDRSLSSVENSNVLARIAFGPQNFDNTSSIQTGLRPLSVGTNMEEIWYSNGQVERGSQEDIFWSRDHNTLVAGTYLSEDDEDLESSTYKAYSQLLAFISRSPNLKIVRIWNYVPRINQEENGLERYKSFSIGRYNAFTEASFSESDYCSACAVGNDGERGVVYMLASSNMLNHFENPDQISAFKYPKEYGPRSPSFARATLAHSLPPTFFISGTASIIGSQTMHIDDLPGQLGLTHQNISKLIEVSDQFLDTTHSPNPYIIKVYVRHPEQLDIIKTAVEQMFDKDTQCIYLRGDICRKELLVEIDGTCVFQKS